MANQIVDFIAKEALKAQQKVEKYCEIHNIPYPYKEEDIKYHREEREWCAYRECDYCHEPFTSYDDVHEATQEDKTGDRNVCSLYHDCWEAFLEELEEDDIEEVRKLKECYGE